MKFLTLVAVGLIGLNAMAQNASMAYNPDSNGDDLIGATDLVSLLGLYNTLMIDTSNTCDYEGTEFEQLVTGLLSEELILDSVYVEYVLIDSQLTYSPGCPDPVYLDVVLDRSYMLTGSSIYTNNDEIILSAGQNYLGFSRGFLIVFDILTGEYSLRVSDGEVSELLDHSYSSYWSACAPICCCQKTLLPFPEQFTLDEDGIQLDWYPGQWAHNCEHLRVIPYWHEAE